MARPNGRDEWRLYLRDHPWWWKWPLIATTTGIWIGAMVLFIAPWRSNGSGGDVETRSVTTEQTDDDASSGSAGVPSPSSVTKTTELDDEGDTPPTTLDEGADLEIDDEPSPPIVTPTSVEETVEVTETTAVRRRQTQTTRQAGPVPIATLPPSPFGANIFATQPTTTVRPTTGSSTSPTLGRCRM